MPRPWQNMPRRRARLPWIWRKRPIAKSPAAWVRPAALWVQKGSNEPLVTPLVVQVSAHLQAVATDLDAGHLWIAISDHVSPIRSCSFEFSWQNFSLAKPFLLQIPSMPSKLHEQRPSSSASLPPTISTSEELLTSLESYSLATGLLMHHLAWEPSEPSEFEGWNVESLQHPWIPVDLSWRFGHCCLVSGFEVRDVASFYKQFVMGCLAVVPWKHVVQLWKLCRGFMGSASLPFQTHNQIILMCLCLLW